MKTEMTYHTAMIDALITENTHPPVHYYGDIVRKLFFSAGFVMLISLPFLHNRIPFPLHVSLLTIIAISLVAGFINPRQRVVMLSDFMLSLGGAVIFEYYAVITYIEYSFKDPFFWINEILAIIFFIALYFATKTVSARLWRY